MRLDLDELTKTLKVVVTSTLKNLSFPMGKELFSSLVLAFSITTISFVCELLGWITLVHWQGAALATTSLVILYIIERKEHNEISRGYSIAKQRIENAKSQLSRAGKQSKARGPATDMRESDSVDTDL